MAIANKEKFQLRIGLTHLFQSYFKPLLLELYKRHPQAEINISVTDSSHLETMLNEGTIDLALIQRPYRSEGFDFVSFDPVRLVAVISKNVCRWYRKVPLIIRHWRHSRWCCCTGRKIPAPMKC